jgi:hypothetical protein
MIRLRRWNLVMALLITTSGFAFTSAVPATEPPRLVCFDGCKNDCDYTCDDPECPVKNCKDGPCTPNNGPDMAFNTTCEPAS